MTFLQYYLQILIFTAVLPLALGIAVYFCNRAFCSLVGYQRGRPILLFLHAVLTPIREFAHLVACIVTFHHVSDFCLLNLHDPEGELGFVEHSYNRKNPIAVFGNYLFAVLPAALGLFLCMLVIITCFGGVLGNLAEGVAVLVEGEAELGEYVRLAADFVPALFRDATGGAASRAIGCVLLLFLSLGVFVSMDDLCNAILGMALYAVGAFLFAGVTALFDARSRRLILTWLRTYATGVTALYLVVLIFAAAMLVLALIFFAFRTFFGEGGGGLPTCVAESCRENEDEYDDDVYDNKDER